MRIRVSFPKQNRFLGVISKKRQKWPVSEGEFGATKIQFKGGIRKKRSVIGTNE